MQVGIAPADFTQRSGGLATIVMARHENQIVRQPGQPLGQSAKHFIRVSAGQVHPPAALHEEGVSRHQVPLPHQETLAAGSVSRCVQEAHRDVPHLHHVVAVMKNQVMGRQPGQLTHAIGLASMHVHRHIHLLLEIGQSLHLVAEQIAADVVRVVVGGQDAGQFQVLCSHGVQQAGDIPGRIHQEGLTALPVGNQIDEVEHLPGKRVGRREIDAGEQLPDDDPIFHAEHHNLPAPFDARRRFVIEGITMLDIITRWTSLPNPHPFLVHFPIALLPAALLLEIMGLIRARPWWASRAAAFLLILAAVLTFAAYEAGDDAADSLSHVSLTAQEQIDRHHDAAAWAMRLTILAALLRIAVVLHGRTTRSWNRAERGLAALVMAGAMVMVVWTADLGGQLVYRYGLGVQQIEPSAAPAEAAPEGSVQEGINPEEAAPQGDADEESVPTAPTADEGVRGEN